ncbi:MAG TPA: MFS transporter [Flavisolibacter sp.]|jgi:MFS family permease|nr:MFS transporter [Flavisolibacter sp.]
MSQLAVSIGRTNKVYRIAVSTLFFLQGLCFATWASRIPTIQQQLALSESMLGVVLFAIPVGSLLSLLFSGGLVTRYGSKKVATNALLLYSLFLPLIGLSDSLVLLILALVLFGMAGNIANIAINTQAVLVEAKFEKNIMASFHGLWSLAGFLAAGVGSYMMGSGILPLMHFIIIATVLVAGVAISFHYLLPDEKQPAVATKGFVKPDRFLLTLGVIAFCCMICEGAMFDWSGIYFQKIIGADKDWVGAGYTAFMSAMATGRFVADWVANRLGFRRTIVFSGLFIATGLLISVLAPYLVSAIVGFMLVGIGVSAVVPLVYSEAGKSTGTATGKALTAVSSIGFLGFLMGPPLIGVLAGAFNLRISFAFIALMGLLITLLVLKSRYFRKTS